MKRPAVVLSLLLATVSVCGQATPPAPQAAGDARRESALAEAPLVDLLASLELSARQTTLDLQELRIDKWKTGADEKEQLQSNADSLQRNLVAAFPALLQDVRRSPASLAANFKLYRNVDVVYDVLSGLVQAAGSVGKKDEYRQLLGDAQNLSEARRLLAERLEEMAVARDAELARLRSQPVQRKPPETPPKKIIIDDSQPAPKRKPKP